MLQVKYSIYKSTEDYSSMIEGDICNDIYDVATKLLEIDNQRIYALTDFMLNKTNDIKIKNFIHNSVSQYIDELAEDIRNHYDSYRSKSIPIDEMPDYTYLDTYYVHKFVIEVDE